VTPRQILDIAAADQHPGFCWLDGGSETPGFLGLEPAVEIEGDDLALLDVVEREWRANPTRRWMGWMTYDLGASVLLGSRPRVGRIPGIVMRGYDQTERLEPRPQGLAPPEMEWPLEALRPEVDAETYRALVRLAQEYVRAGETYQVNLSQRFVASFRTQAPGSVSAAVAAIYAHLLGHTPASMGALIRVGPERWIVSNSPETLIDVRLGAGEDGGDVARSWPIKGTRPRHADSDQDAAAGAELLASEKDRAEHVMIVDLVRNDLGRLARVGSVRAPDRGELVSLPTVHHLVSEVRCTLEPGWSLRGLFEAMFPGGSITGAPKRRTVEIVAELEREPREIYCGAIVSMDAEGLRVSIPIRTGIVDRTGLVLRSGGGIVIDSDPEAERLETLAKARAFDPQADF
jgi:para-aminobenzoate synthetase component 1